MLCAAWQLILIFSLRKIREYGIDALEGSQDMLRCLFLIVELTRDHSKIYVCGRGRPGRPAGRRRRVRRTAASWRWAWDHRRRLSLKRR